MNQHDWTLSWPPTFRSREAWDFAHSPTGVIPRRDPTQDQVYQQKPINPPNQASPPAGDQQSYSNTMRHALGYGQEQPPINPSTYAQPYPYEQPQAAPYGFDNGYGYQPTPTPAPESSPSSLPSSSYLYPPMSMVAHQAWDYSSWQPQSTPYNPVPSAPMLAQNYPTPYSFVSAPTPQPNAPATAHRPDHPAPPPPFGLWCCQNCKTGRVPPYDEGQRSPYLCWRCHQYTETVLDN